MQKLTIEIDEETDTAIERESAGGSVEEQAARIFTEFGWMSH